MQIRDNCSIFFYKPVLCEPTWLGIANGLKKFFTEDSLVTVCALQWGLNIKEIFDVYLQVSKRLHLCVRSVMSLIMSASIRWRSASVRSIVWKCYMTPKSICLKLCFVQIKSTIIILASVSNKYGDNDKLSYSLRKFRLAHLSRSKRHIFLKDLNCRATMLTLLATSAMPEWTQ